MHSNKGTVVEYDKLVLATGSYPWVPPIQGSQHHECFVYRTIEDLKAIRSAAKSGKSGVVIGVACLASKPPVPSRRWVSRPTWWSLLRC